MPPERGRVAASRAGGSVSKPIAWSPSQQSVYCEATKPRQNGCCAPHSHGEVRRRPPIRDVAEMEILWRTLARADRAGSTRPTSSTRARWTQVRRPRDEHPEVARLGSIWASMLERERYDDARRHLTRALAIQQKAFGADSIRVAPTSCWPN